MEESPMRQYAEEAEEIAKRAWDLFDSAKYWGLFCEVQPNLDDNLIGFKSKKYGKVALSWRMIIEGFWVNNVDIVLNPYKNPRIDF
jgi:hypothetical protein